MRYTFYLWFMAAKNPQSVIEYTPHGCRHVQVIAGTQLASQGLIGELALESLGHWGKGSKMPRLYDSARCVTELQARKAISDALRSGWRPASDGNLPMPATPVGILTPSPSTPGITAKVVHVDGNGGRVENVEPSSNSKTVRNRVEHTPQPSTPRRATENDVGMCVLDVRNGK